VSPTDSLCFLLKPTDDVIGVQRVPQQTDNAEDNEKIPPNVRPERRYKSIQTGFVCDFSNYLFQQDTIPYCPTINAAQGPMGAKNGLRRCEHNRLNEEWNGTEPDWCDVEPVTPLWFQHFGVL
jgi:hypothetical protein